VTGITRHECLEAGGLKAWNTTHEGTERNENHDPRRGSSGDTLRHSLGEPVMTSPSSHVVAGRKNCGTEELQLKRF
jgi:hypothetical protein